MGSALFFSLISNLKIESAVVLVRILSVDAVDIVVFKLGKMVSESQKQSVSLKDK